MFLGLIWFALRFFFFAINCLTKNYWSFLKLLPVNGAHQPKSDFSYKHLSIYSTERLESETIFSSHAVRHSNQQESQIPTLAPPQFLPIKPNISHSNTPARQIFRLAIAD